MPTVRDDLIPVVDEARGILDELGFRRVAVIVRRRVWSGGEPGRGEPADTDTVLMPKPKVLREAPRWAYAEPGRWEAGDVELRGVSVTYTEADLGAGPTHPGTEYLWLLDNGESTSEYILQGYPDQRPLEWRVHLRRRKRARQR